MDRSLLLNKQTKKPQVVPKKFICNKGSFQVWLFWEMWQYEVRFRINICYPFIDERSLQRQLLHHFSFLLFLLPCYRCQHPGCLFPYTKWLSTWEFGIIQFLSKNLSLTSCLGFFSPTNYSGYHSFSQHLGEVPKIKKVVNIRWDGWSSRSFLYFKCVLC